MKVTINLKPFAISMASFAIAYSIVTEKIDQYITFAGEANAFGCFVLASTMGLMALVASFEKTTK
tara:strand:+ start:1468 stop:1662 length:195 start_codon:yes stop_codon:yes gene_type:complete